MFFKKRKIVVEFYLIDSFEIYHFLPLYYYFLDEGFDVRFIAEPCYRNISHDWFDYDIAYQILNKLGVRYAKKVNKHADFAFTTQDAYLLDKYSKKTKKANLSYGFSYIKNYFIHSERTTKGFDYRLVHGKAQKEMLSQFMEASRIYIVGYPKYEKIKYDRNDLLKELGVNTDKKILCYFPTWDEDASIAKYYKKLKELSKKYFIITKPHHCTARLKEKQEDLSHIKEISDVVLDGNFDFAKAAMLGDVAVCDAKSGSTMEVPYLNPEIKLVILFNQEFTEEKYNREILNVGSCVFNVDILESAIEDVLSEDLYAEERSRQMILLYGNRQTDYLKEIVELIKKESK